MELNKDGIELTEEDLTKIAGGAVPNPDYFYFYCGYCDASFGHYWEDGVQGGHANFACLYHRWREHGVSKNPCDESGWGYSEEEQYQIVVTEYGQTWYK